MAGADRIVDTLTAKIPNNVNSARARNTVVGKGAAYNNKYQSDTLQYPNDLFSNQEIYGGNYAVFYINVPSNSALIKGKEDGLTTSLDTAQLRGVVAGANYGVGSIAAVGSVGAVAATGVLNKIKTGSFKGTAGTALKAAIVGAVPGVIVSAIATDGNVNPMKTVRQNRRLITSIALNIPQSFTARYSMDYSTEDMSAQAAIADLAGDMGNAVVSSNRSAALGKGVSDAIGIAGAAALSTPGIGGFMSAATGLARNPKKEQIFTGVEFRTFNFEYNFAPRNKKETEEVKKIINMFKLHMHPEFKDDGGFLFIYPSEFDIYYYKDGVENMNLPRHTTCILTEMTVNYAPNGSFNTFADGTPSQITVSMTFRELAILTKAEIQDGY
ncbi:hypothetical protein UFOVP58_155 [uncultured Caudovirales phage]|uniref:Baseplate tail tube cap n=1 Tax=uncultured Caudovirales phage TaxID=2100421 RepID=A0A6J5KX55_9CAUD|nr:hypothetical protein UFOVP58_155 [uncultured Caudovirales phage]